jgi:hypothetical protein
MNYEYVRIDVFRLFVKEKDPTWLHQQPDCEYREDYQCWFILKGSKTHTLAALKYGDIFE